MGNKESQTLSLWGNLQSIILADSQGILQSYESFQFSNLSPRHCINTLQSYVSCFLKSPIQSLRYSLSICSSLRDISSVPDTIFLSFYEISQNPFHFSERSRSNLRFARSKPQILRFWWRKRKQKCIQTNYEHYFAGSS